MYDLILYVVKISEPLYCLRLSFYYMICFHLLFSCLLSTVVRFQFTRPHPVIIPEISSLFSHLVHDRLVFYDVLLESSRIFQPNFVFYEEE